MNKKTFSVAVSFLILTLVWLGLNAWWLFVSRRPCTTGFDLVVAVLFVGAGAMMVWNESKKKRRRHLADADKRRIP